MNEVFSTRENLKSVCLTREIYNECFGDSKKYEVEQRWRLELNNICQRRLTEELQNLDRRDYFSLGLEKEETILSAF